jgi:Ca-activated chloride channel family protein
VRVRLHRVVAGVIVLGAVSVMAQPVFRSGVELVNFGVTVVDKRGNLVSHLTADDFVVVEEGRSQKIELFVRGDAAPLPLHLGLAFDSSGSMEQDIALSRSAAIKFLNTLPRAEDITLVDFDTEVRVARYGQADFPRLVERIRRRKPDGYTALYDAIGVYLDGAGDDSGQKILVVYTDGGDTRSAMTFNEVIDLVKASDVTVYGIGFLEHQTSSSRMNQRLRLQQLTEASGGQAYFPLSVKELDGIYAKIVEEINARYVLGYQSSDPSADGAWRQVDVRLARGDLKDLRIRTRKGYFAPLRDAGRP